ARNRGMPCNSPTRKRLHAVTSLGSGRLAGGTQRTALAMRVSCSAQASIDSVGTSAADASYCRQRWAYYDPVARKYMGDDGEWRSCRAGSAVQVAAATKRHTRKPHRA